MTSDAPNTERELVPRIDSGMVLVNEFSKILVPVPIGGVKCSGIVRELGDLDIREFVNAKTVFVKSKSLNYKHINYPYSSFAQL